MEVKLGELFVNATRFLSEIEGHWQRLSFSNEWHSLEISRRPSSPTAGTFHNERALSEWQSLDLIGKREWSDGYVQL